MTFLRNIFLTSFNAYHFPLIASGIVGISTFYGQKLFFTNERIASSQFLQYLPLITSFVTCILGYRFLTRAIPTRDIGSKVHFHGEYNVAVKYFDLSTSANHPTFHDAKTGKQLKCPGAAIYYPTVSKVDDNRRDLWPSWCPFDDQEYAYGFSNYVSLPRFMFGHYITSKIRALNGNDPAQEKTIELPPKFETEVGSNKFPVVLFSHGLAGHSRAYTTFACELASRGAVVICPTFTDGSAIYSRSHPEKALWPGPAHENSPAAVSPTSSSNGKKKSATNGEEEEKSFEVFYVMPPPEGSEVQQQARNDFRMRQIKHRVMEIEQWQNAIENGDALKWIFSNTKSASSSTSNNQQQQSFIKNIEAAATKLRNQENSVRLTGHSFGASTSFIAATEKCLKNSSSSTKKQLPPVVLLDLWWLLPELRFGMKSGVFRGQVPTEQKAGIRTDASRNGTEFIDPTNLPDLQIIDSQLWQNEKHDSRPFFNFLTKEWPKKVTSNGVKGTDHIAVSDLGIFSPVVSRNKNIVKYDEFSAEDVPRIQAEMAWKALVVDSSKSE